MAAGKTDGTSTFDSSLEDEMSTKNKSDLMPLEVSTMNRDQSLPTRNFGVFDAALVLISLITYLVDSLTDILVTVQYFQAAHYTWAVLTLGFVILPSLVTQIFSLRWYQADGKLYGKRIWLVHIFQLQPLERYIGVLMAGMDARTTGDKEKVQAYYYQQNDASMLRLFEAFLESAPQLTLQLYIMVATKDANWLTALSAAISLISVGWAVSIYNHALRQAHREDYHIQWPSLLLHTVWHIGVVAARVCALVAFASLYKTWVFLFIGVHWIVMTVWVMAQQTDFCPSQVEERLFNAVVGVIYIYCFFSLKEGQTRWRLLFFYTLLFLENVILVVVWYPFRVEDGWTTDALIAIIFGAFFLGIGCMMIYYRFCHPSGPIYCCPPPKDDQPHTSPTLPRKISGLYHLQVDLLPRTSNALLNRNAQLKPQTSLTMAAVPVVFKEVHTPSQLSPVMENQRCRRVINYNETMEVSANSLFRHYSIETSQCIEVSRCATLNGDTIDLTQADVLQEEFDELSNDQSYSFDYIDDGVSEVSLSSVESSNYVGKEYKVFYARQDSGCGTSNADSPMSGSNASPLTSGHGSVMEEASPGSSSIVAPVTPRLPHHAVLTILPDFSPIAEGHNTEKTNAGCHKFPTNWKQIATVASTPHTKTVQKCVLAIKKPDHKERGSKRNLYAPLASPEVSLTESMCNLDEDSFYHNEGSDDPCDELDRTNYDNVPNSPNQNDSSTLGAQLDNISGCTYMSQGSDDGEEPCGRKALSLNPYHTDPCVV